MPEKFKVLLSALAAGILAILYIWKPVEETNRFWELCYNTIPNFMAIFITIIVLYFLFGFLGVDTLKSTSPSEVENKASEIHNQNEHIVSTLSRIAQIENLKHIEGFYDDFNDVNWRSLIRGSSVEIDIVVYYFDSWVNRYRDDLIYFFKKSDVKVNLILPNPDIDENISAGIRIFPEKDEKSLTSKINNTKNHFEGVIDDANANRKQLKFLLCKRPISYSILRFDKKQVVLSPFEMYRKGRISSPAILINTAESEKSSIFFEKEIAGLIGDSKKA